MGPLSGIRVIDLTTMVSGPVAAMMLADQGAEVIKVEPTQGEQMRHLGALHHGISPMFFSCNRGKKSIALDLKASAGRDILNRLAGTADVFIQNFRPGAIDRMGFAADRLCRDNPKLIYVSISGFGEKGPYAHQRVYDPVIQALSGATDIQRDQKTGRPKMFRIIVADKVTSLTAAQAVTSALFARERGDGKGQHVRLSMLDAMVSFFWPEGMVGLTYAEREMDPATTGGKMDLVYETKDGFITAGVITDQEWVGLCKALQREDLIRDDRFSTVVDRFRNHDIRKQIISNEIAGWFSADILKRLDAEDVPSAPLIKRADILDNEQYAANETIQIKHYDGFGEVRQARPAATFSGTGSAIQGPAPQLSEHARPLLTELGYTSAEMDTLKTTGVVTF